MGLRACEEDLERWRRREAEAPNRLKALADRERDWAAREFADNSFALVLDRRRRGGREKRGKVLRLFFFFLYLGKCRGRVWVEQLSDTRTISVPLLQEGARARALSALSWLRAPRSSFLPHVSFGVLDPLFGGESLERVWRKRQKSSPLSAVEGIEPRVLLGGEHLFERDVGISNPLRRAQAMMRTLAPVRRRSKLCFPL